MEVPKYSAPNALMLRRVQHGRQGFTAGTCTERSWKVMVNGAVLRWEVGGLVDSSMNCSVGLFSMISRLDHKKIQIQDQEPWTWTRGCLDLELNYLYVSNYILRILRYLLY